jgi:predicted transglutaminase-like protease
MLKDRFIPNQYHNNKWIRKDYFFFSIVSEIILFENNKTIILLFQSTTNYDMVHSEKLIFLVFVLIIIKWKF